MTYEGTQGSCKNPYGGNINPSRIDFAEWIANPDCLGGGKYSGVQLFALTQISHAAADYLFYGLGRNGYTVDKWFEAIEFFWRTRSDKPETWQDSPSIKQTWTEDGKQLSYVQIPDPETLKLQCFDKYYELSGLDKIMTLNVFLERLLKERKRLLLKSKDQVEEYFKFCWQAQSINQMPLAITDSKLFDVLLLPESPEQVEKYLIPPVSAPFKKTNTSKKNATNILQDSFVGKQNMFVFKEGDSENV